jgi:tRNA1Val (adenine37-N6)-methyltransferase
MKIGTDGVLLGAWATISHNPFSVLDIGSGTGVLALMIAQRSDAELIEAIEIDGDAFEQCVTNFENSKWNDRVFCYHASLLEFSEEIEDTYDLIICNPPFYLNAHKTKNTQRDLARFEEAMPFDHLIQSAAKLLSPNGRFCVIIPYKEELAFIELASQVQLFPNKLTRIKGNESTPVKRSLIEFTFHKNDLQSSELIIEKERHQYTQDYIDLTKDFYIKL